MLKANRQQGCNDSRNKSNDKWPARLATSVRVGNTIISTFLSLIWHSFSRISSNLQRGQAFRLSGDYTSAQKPCLQGRGNLVPRGDRGLPP